MRHFLMDTFTGGLLNGSGLVLTIIFGLITVFALPSGYAAIKALICIILGLLYLCVVLAVRAKQFYMTYARRIKVVRQINGEGSRMGNSYVAITNPGFLRDNILLTLYSPASGADQSVCLLKIEKAQPGQEILASPFGSGAAVELSRYFDNDNTTRLYVNTMIHVDDLLAMLRGLQVGDVTAQPYELAEREDG